LIIKQISAAKSKVLKYLDDIEEKLITEVGSVQEKNEEKINTEKHEICQLTSILKDNKQELEFLKEHGSNNQLFLTLRKQITIIQKTDKTIHDMTSVINEIDMEFKVCLFSPHFFPVQTLLLLLIFLQCHLDILELLI
jgi:ABC-type enterochelin transport system substrate-binding protein